MKGIELNYEKNHETREVESGVESTAQKKQILGHLSGFPSRCCWRCRQAD